MVKGLCPDCEQFHMADETCERHRCTRCGEWIEDETIPDGCEDILDCPEQGNG